VSGANNISTLVTIVYGLILTDLFASMHRLIRNRSRVRWHWLPLLVSWYVLVIVLKNWWGLVFSGEESVWESGWIFFFYGHLLMLLYLVASAALPDDVPAGGLDMLEYYVEHRRYFWGLFAGVNTTLLVFALLRPAISGQPPNWLAALSNIVMAVVAISLAWVGRIRYHVVVVLALVALVVLEMIQKF